MALKGQGAVIIWNDITPEGRADFYDWHVNEHIPERVAIPGFLRGRRYIATDSTTTPEFLTLYETLDEAVLSSAAYLARLNDPTPWTKRATAHFRNTSRCLTTLVTSKGAGVGCFMTTLRIPHSDSGMEISRRLSVSANSLAETLVVHGVTGLAAGLSDREASNTKTAESKGRSDLLQPPIGVLLIEGVTLDAVKAATAQVTRQLEPLGDAVWGFYTLEFGLDP
jgi:hypothetical protein